MDVIERNPFLKRTPTLDELDPVGCVKCGNGIFGRYYRVYKPKGESSTSNLFTVPVFVCANCSEVVSSKHDEKQLSVD